MNLLAIIGTLTRDAEIRYTHGGTAIGNFSIAVNRYWKGQDGEFKEEVSYFQCTAFGKTAEKIVEKYGKGDKIAITGKLKQDRWEKDGQKHSRVVIVVDQVTPSCSKKQGGQQTTTEQKQPYDQQPQQQQAYRQPPQQSTFPEPDVVDDEIPF
jgi:single-strand DNA-binding protein